MTERIYRYVVRYDAGTAPRPYGGVCSLAICKPLIRAQADVGDWIIGFRSKRPGEVVYVMHVDERLTLGEYWLDQRFRDRRPGSSMVPDNFYRPKKSGELTQVSNIVHDKPGTAKDVRGRNVLLARRFWYFGSQSVPLPNELIHLVHTTQGHVVHKSRRPGDVGKLRRWLAAWKPGIHGPPIGGATPGAHQVDASGGRTASAKGLCAQAPNSNGGSSRPNKSGSRVIRNKMGRPRAAPK